MKLEREQTYEAMIDEYVDLTLTLIGFNSGDSSARKATTDLIAHLESYGKLRGGYIAGIRSDVVTKIKAQL